MEGYEWWGFYWIFGEDLVGDAARCGDAVVFEIGCYVHSVFLGIFGFRVAVVMVFLGLIRELSGLIY